MPCTRCGGSGWIRRRGAASLQGSPLSTPEPCPTCLGHQTYRPTRASTWALFVLLLLGAAAALIRAIAHFLG